MRVVSVAGLQLFIAALLALDSMSSSGVSAQRYNAVEYKFHNVVNDTVVNTGVGDPSPSSSLNGVLYPETGNGIDFPDNVAKFGRLGCIQVPDSVDVNKGSLTYGMISMRFKWGGLLGTQPLAQVLYEEGDADAGLNIYLDRLTSGGRARLFMAVWKSGKNRLRAQVVRTSKKKIRQGKWYRVTMVLDADAGTLSGYLDNDLIDEKDVNFFPIRSRQGGNCLGGMKDGTLIFETEDKDPDEYSINFLYFKGHLDNFRIRNERSIDSTPAVEYTFSRKNNPYENTGTGPDLDGIPRPGSSNGIKVEGRIGAKFSGKGCIQVPDSDDVNLSPVSDRTIMLDFQWDGTVANNNEPAQMLFEEGGHWNGINIYLDSFNGNKAELVMAVWVRYEGADGLFRTRPSFVHTDVIRKNTWYQLSMVLDRFGISPNGTLTGYLDGVEFDEAEIDFFEITAHSQNNCLGGMHEYTRTFSTDGSGPSEGQEEDGNGLYFNGLIDNFLLFNEVVRPVVPTTPPSEAPTTTSPSKPPTTGDLPTLAPSTKYPSDEPSNRPSKYPSSSPSGDPTTSPSKLPTAAPVPPTKRPTQEPTASPTKIPTQEPTGSPAKAPTETPTKAPTASPNALPSEQPTPWNDVTYDDFEGGWGNFQASGSFASRVTSSGSRYIPQGTAAIRITGYFSTSSFGHTESHDVSEYSNLRVQFSYYLRDLDEGDGFLLEYSPNGGMDWTTVKEFEFGNDGQSGSVNTATVNFNEEMANTYARTNEARLRFRCDVSAINKYVYIDEVAFQGFAP